jgi:hypothetical protein
LRLGSHALASTSSVSMAGATFVSDEASLNACTDACVLVEAHRVRAAVTAKTAELDVVLQ